MGRGRQKAKATRQARDIKYYSPATDLTALERELGGARTTSNRNVTPVAKDDYDEDDYSTYEDKYANYDDEDDTRRIG
ncbi:DUF3073 domain-containing protein [Neomicrococcus aestuarii]|uniref:DUF3073 domain-containing protein n=1 Tax=Neomicrococcus aestuarii TaxID=556325 RepID=A0A1L2ZQC1_9MICC|nr:DUF3073 domain-containing protein [Neomicrococcus aestuarii]APF41367.1 hypothetical protein BHE16_10600 [Neomicrococcus aestuarii]MBB5513297.1 hypothetical protein [Neomicrococcus aestuarii]